MLGQLTVQQHVGVVRIVQAELVGRSLASLLTGDDRICAHSTYYRQRGWNSRPEFRQALRLARRDYRQWLLEHGTGEALAVLGQAAPEAARALRQQVAGDEPAVAALEMALAAKTPELRAMAAKRLGETGLPRVVEALVAALQREKVPEVKEAVVEALGQVAGFRGADRRAAAGGILDRAAVETASKQALAVSELPGDVTDEELEAIEEALEGVGNRG